MSRANRYYHKHLYQPSQEHWQCRYLLVFCGHLQALSITNDKMMIFRKKKCQQSRIRTTQLRVTTFPKTDKVQRHYSWGKPQWSGEMCEDCCGGFLIELTTWAPSQDEFLCCFARITLEKMAAFPIGKDDFVSCYLLLKDFLPQLLHQYRYILCSHAIKTWLLYGLRTNNQASFLQSLLLHSCWGKFTTEKLITKSLPKEAAVGRSTPPTTFLLLIPQTCWVPWGLKYPVKTIAAAHYHHL